MTSLQTFNVFRPTTIMAKYNPLYGKTPNTTTRTDVVSIPNENEMINAHLAG